MGFDGYYEGVRWWCYVVDAHRGLTINLSGTELLITNCS